jgi:putative ABC transport system ATP-binding protein
VIELQGISKHYRLGDIEYPALTGIDLVIQDNEFMALTGPSGSGKSTLMNILGCLDTPTSGRYTLDGTEVAGLDDELIYRGIAPARRREHASRALQRVGLGDRMGHRPNEMSGGQRQRVAVARALVGNPELLLADEPTGNLDSRTAGEIMDLFSQLHAEGQTVVVVTHDPGIAACCKRVVRLHDGQIAEDRNA